MIYDIYREYLSKTGNIYYVLKKRSWSSSSRGMITTTLTFEKVDEVVRFMGLDLTNLEVQDDGDSYFIYSKNLNVLNVERFYELTALVQYGKILCQKKSIKM